MTVPAIGAIGAIGSALPTTFTSALNPTELSAAAASPSDAAANAASSAGFGSALSSVIGKGIGAVQGAQSNADNLAVKAATGDLTDIQDYTIASTQASLVTELASAIRTKGVEAFNQIMGMQA